MYQLGILDAAGTAISSAAADGGGDWGNTGTAVATAFNKQITPTLNNIATVTPAANDRKLGIKGHDRAEYGGGRHAGCHPVLPGG